MKKKNFDVKKIVGDKKLQNRSFDQKMAEMVKKSVAPDPGSSSLLTELTQTRFGKGATFFLASEKFRRTV